MNKDLDYNQKPVKHTYKQSKTNWTLQQDFKTTRQNPKKTQQTLLTTLFTKLNIQIIKPVNNLQLNSEKNSYDLISNPSTTLNNSTKPGPKLSVFKTDAAKKKQNSVNTERTKQNNETQTSQNSNSVLDSIEMQPKQSKDTQTRARSQGTERNAIAGQNENSITAFNNKNYSHDSIDLTYKLGTGVFDSVLLLSELGQNSDKGKKTQQLNKIRTHNSAV